MNQNSRPNKVMLGLMFFISGFSALLYQTIWLRLAFAEFGVITPVISIIVSVFMLGLGLGSWIGGSCIAALKRLTIQSAITIYGCVEMFIGMGAFVVPKFFHYGALAWICPGEMNSFLYLLNSALAITISVLPFSIAMGMTYPIMLEFLGEQTSKDQDPGRFGFLYAANTLGACFGAISTVFILIELMGFTRTLVVGALGNFIIALISISWGVSLRRSVSKTKSAVSGSEQSILRKKGVHSFVILFITGFCSMSMEVIWTRSFTPILGTLVYSFALLLSAYLFSNWLGAYTYRLSLRQNNTLSVSTLIILCALCSIFPVLASNPLIFKSLLSSNHDLFKIGSCILISIMPLSAVLGYLTPLIIDNYSASNPKAAGHAYALNILGCVLGPLFAGYVFLPVLGAGASLILLVVPFLVLSLCCDNEYNKKMHIKIATCVIGSLTLFNAWFWPNWEEAGLEHWLHPDITKVITHRDYAATTTSLETDNEKFLLVNGQTMTSICRSTKYMAYLPLSFHTGKVKSVLIICFGMGTTFRSALAWDNCTVTAIELVPGVVKAFNYYYPDATTVRNNTNGRIVIDDGRRFLRRVSEKFDVIIVDPPPPLASACSGLLYSKEFFALIKSHLNPGGILEQWYGYGKAFEPMVSMLKALQTEFGYVRMFRVDETPLISGWHFLASESPIYIPTPQQFYARLPNKAKNDLLEKLSLDKGTYDLQKQLKDLLSKEIPVNTVLASSKNVMITDNYPLNEYCLLRTLTGHQVYLWP